MIHIVGIADMKLASSLDDALVTHALGSCLGVTIFDPVAGVGGLLHCMLPSSRISPEGGLMNPWKFVDTGVPAMFRAAYELGARKDEIIVTVCGGAAALCDKGVFRIGERNYKALRRLLWKNGVSIAAEDVGGAFSRTVQLEMKNGRVLVNRGGVHREIWGSS